MARKMTPFLMFEGSAEEAMTTYVSVFPGSQIREVERYRAGEPGAEGSVKRALFTVAGQDVYCIDSPVHHAFTFTPAVSLFVECESEAELESAFALLSAGGQVLMELNNYGFSKKFGWLNGSRYPRRCNSPCRTLSRREDEEVLRFSSPASCEPNARKGRYQATRTG
jgi:predicted 3-demethylubiquinone-9 3-methyltransferase (glyoxalase superfamily)